MYLHFLRKRFEVEMCSRERWQWEKLVVAKGGVGGAKNLKWMKVLNGRDVSNDRGPASIDMFQDSMAGSS